MNRILSSMVVSVVLAGCPKPGTPEPASGGTTTEVETPPTMDTDAPPMVAEPEPEPAMSSEQVQAALTRAVGTLTLGTPEAATRALVDLEAIASLDDAEPLAFYNLGLAYDLLDRQDDAERAYDVAIEATPPIAQAFLGKAVLLERQDRMSEALSTYAAGIEADDTNMELRSAYIGALRRAGKLEKAITQAKAALAFNSKSLEVYNDLGLVYMDQGDLSMARFVYLKALTLEGAKSNASIRTNFGWALYLSGEPVRGRLQMEESYKLDATNLRTLVYLSHLYMDDRNYTDAVPLLKEAYKQEPTNFGIILNLGIANRGIGNLEEAKRMYELAMQEKPTDPAPFLNMGVLLGDYFKDYDGAVAAFNSYLERGGKEVDTVEQYIEDVNKEKARAEKQKQREAERQRRAAEKAERERLLKEAAEKEAAEKEAAGPTPTPPNDSSGTDEAGGGDTPASPTPEPAAPPSEQPSEEPPPSPAPEEPSEDSGDDNPWGQQ